MIWYRYLANRVLTPRNVVVLASIPHILNCQNSRLNTQVRRKLLRELRKLSAGSAIFGTIQGCWTHVASLNVQMWFSAVWTMDVYCMIQIKSPPNIIEFILSIPVKEGIHSLGVTMQIQEERQSSSGCHCLHQLLGMINCRVPVGIRFCPAPVQVHTMQVATITPIHHTIEVEHGDYFEDKRLAQGDCRGMTARQEV